MGRVIGVVANLKPVTVMGVESNGMILAASAPPSLPYHHSYTLVFRRRGAGRLAPFRAGSDRRR